MKKISAIFIVLILTPVQVHASLEKELSRCAIIEGELKRLDCYDSAAKRHKLTPKKITTNGNDNGKWHIQEQINPVDDTNTVFIFLDADSGKGKYGDTISFIARCQSNKTEAYVKWESFLSTDNINILTRIGENKATTETWDISSDRKASFRRKPIAFLKKMMGASKLILQTTPHGESPITAIFDTSGLKNAIQPLRKQCSW